MNIEKKSRYLSPKLIVVEFKHEGVFCTSTGSLDELKPGPDWSDTWDD